MGVEFRDGPGVLVGEPAYRIDHAVQAYRPDMVELAWHGRKLLPPIRRRVVRLVKGRRPALGDEAAQHVDLTAGLDHCHLAARCRQGCPGLPAPLLPFRSAGSPALGAISFRGVTPATSGEQAG